MGKLREIKSIAVLFGIISIVLGIVLVVIPGQTQLIINTIVGVALLVVGLIGIFGFASLKKRSNHSGAMVILPVVIAILGLFVLLNPDVTIFTVGILMAVFALVMAIDNFMIALNSKKRGEDTKAIVIFGVIHLVFAILMAWNVFATMTAIVMIAGIYLIVNGVTMLAVSSIVNNVEEITYEIEESIDKSKHGDRFR
jgi:Uncharacterized conserved protein